jgi:hypothetical protein
MKGSIADEKPRTLKIRTALRIAVAATAAALPVMLVRSADRRICGLRLSADGYGRDADRNLGHQYTWLTKDWYH